MRSVSRLRKPIFRDTGPISRTDLFLIAFLGTFVTDVHLPLDISTSLFSNI